MRLIALATCLILTFSFVNAQDPNRFAEEIKKFEGVENIYPAENRIVFTGSSSIRFWGAFKSYFPDHNVINTGFGGSHTSDLLSLIDQLVLKFKPKQVFVYEGDNDLASKKTPETVIQEMQTLIVKLKAAEVENIVLISAKPSIARWNLKDQYLELNAQLKALAEKTEGVHFADVWTPMLNQNGEVIKDIFIRDGLHMNKKGYDIWIKVIRPLLIKP